MKLSSPLFFVLSTVVSTVLIAAEPCLPKGNDNTNGGYAKYDQPACDFCAHSGKGNGECCNAIYTHSCGRDDDDFADGNDVDLCTDVNSGCIVGAGNCYPGLICVDNPNTDCVINPSCQLPTDNPEAHAAASLVTWSSLTGNATKGSHSVVLVVIGLLVAAMIATKVVQHRHRVLLHRNQYSEVNN